MTAHAGHTLSDWLALHELRPAACRQILEKLVVTPSAEVTAGEGPPTDANELQDKEAWTTVVDAMCCYFPAHRALISATFASSPKIRMERRKGRPPALTLDEGKEYPTIFYSYAGTASDLMVIAHEFGHAVQLVASRGKFVAPIIREVCAFFGEIALVDYLKSESPSRYLELQKVCGADTRKYALSDGTALLTALADRDAPYQYRWNYPIARLLSIETRARYSRARIWTIFEGDLSAKEVLEQCNIMPSSPKE